MGMPLRADLEKASADRLLFVIHPRETDCTRSSTPVPPKASPFAPTFGGVAGPADAAFVAGSGMPGACLCHNGRIIAAAADRDAALTRAVQRVTTKEA